MDTMTKLHPAQLELLQKRFPHVPAQCFDCPCWNNEYSHACDRFYSEKQAWAMPGGCPVGREK